RPDLPLVAVKLRVAALRGRRPRRLPRVPADDVVDRVLAAARAYRPKNLGPRRAELACLRNVALVETLRGAGLRVSEACGLRRGDLRPDRSAIVLGKGAKQRLVLFDDGAAAAIASYHAARADRGPLGALPVFARHDVKVGPATCHPMDPDGVRSVVHALARTAGLADAKLTPHRFRAWFATHVGGATGDLAATQELLGHVDPATTRVYLQVADQRLRDVHRRAFPAGAPPGAPAERGAPA